MSGFYLPSASQSSSPSSSPRSSTDTELPFPAPLQRSDFLAPDFTPSAYLSEVAPHRHQILEDLRSDLRVRSQQLSKELLDLVNAHYVDFLNLGSSLRGGKEKVEEVRVGLMGFQREVEAVRDVLIQKEAEIRDLVVERRAIRSKMERGRALLEWDDRADLLEDRLSVDPTNTDHSPSTGIKVTAPRAGSRADKQDTEDEEEDREDSADELDIDFIGSSSKSPAVSLLQLDNRIKDYNLLRQSALRLGLDHPFLAAQQGRLIRIRNTLLLDLGNCLGQVDRKNDEVLKVLTLYRAMDASKEIVDNLASRTKLSRLDGIGIH